MAEPIDKKQKTDELVKFIGEFTDENGYPPTFREMASAISIGSTSTIHHLVSRMVHNGVATMVGGRAGTLRLVRHDPGISAPNSPALREREAEDEALGAVAQKA